MSRLDQAQSRDARLKRLAQSIDALAEKDQDLLRHAREMATLRRRAAVELHSICAEFVMALNRFLSRTELTLDPPGFSEEVFREEGVNLLQVNTRGRILQIEFSATAEFISTEDFRIPYTLHGSVRAFNQQLLDKEAIEEQLLYYTVERDKRIWRFFDARTYRSGLFDQDYLASLLEQLL